MTDFRARDPRTPFISLWALNRVPEPQPRRDRHDTLATDLRLTCDALRSISDRPTTWARPPRVTCVTRPKFAWDKKNSIVTCNWFTAVPNYIRGNRVYYDQPAKTCGQKRILQRVGSLASEIDKFHDRLVPNMRQAIIWTNADLIHWRIYTHRHTHIWHWG